MSSNAVSSSESGLTLIEVLVALAITALALATGIKATGALLNNSERQSSMLLAQICANNELQRLRLRQQMPGLGEQRFECDQAGLHFSGRLRVRTTPNPLFLRVDAQVLQNEGNAQEISVLRVASILGRI